MQFSRLRLNGFKSFVDQTELVIQPGLTGVVGPNGCGKSNLLEALRWVMGETRPSAMRGGGMEDVIFAGASSRPARAHAEVALLIENEDRLAPASFNDTDQLEVIRRITRDAGSAYRINGKDVRARDVQMLFADASTGAHSPALVRQGQISELINAKPTARRRILEEAAGISGLYQRRHEAELKLKGAEQNLTRVDDVIDGLGQQLATLSRQAKAAQRYREVGLALRAAESLLLWLRWSAADTAHREAEAALNAANQAANLAGAEAEKSAAVRAGFDAALPPLREEESIAKAIMAKLEAERDGLAAELMRAQTTIAHTREALQQVQDDRARENALNGDALQTLAALETERDTLMEAQGDQDEAIAAASAALSEASTILEARESALAERTESTASLAARHQSVERQLQDARRAVDKAEAEAQRIAAALASAETAHTAAVAAFAAAEARLSEASAAIATTDAALEAATTARATAEAAATTARATRADAEGRRNALASEVRGLTGLLAKSQTKGAQLLDQLSVAAGLEKAIGAALADDLSAPVVTAADATGWVALPAYSDAPALPDGATPLGDAIGAPDVLDRLLPQVGLVDAADGARLQALLRPGQRLVSREGDLWRWDGYRVAAGDAPSAAAMRLEQMNRLAQLKAELAEAEAEAAAAISAHDIAAAALKAAATQETAARDAGRAADRALADANRTHSRTEADRNIAASKRDGSANSQRRLAADLQTARAALQVAEAEMAALPDLSAARTEVAEVKAAVDAARITMMTRRTAADDLRRAAETRTRRAQDILREMTSWETRLASAAQRMRELESREAGLTSDLTRAESRPAAITAKREDTLTAIASADLRRAAAAEAVAAAETRLREAMLAEREVERIASEAREARARAEAHLDGTKATQAQVEERIGEILNLSPDALREAVGDPEELPTIPALEEEVGNLKRAREQMGAVNLRAEEDAKQLSDEQTTLLNEKTDLESAIRALRGAIGNLNREGRERLLAAYDQVNENFAMLFTHLFGGGEARLVMVESDDPLEAGLEIMCQPPGKKLSTLSLLSGGEQTLTALALIFAVFLANPAPICVLDEVDAPLDDHNVNRFCDLMDEMTRRTNTRFLVITHHAVTMARMHRLFGVTMAEQGVSQLVSVDLSKAEAMVA
ncbi:SMC protein [Ketogulonicigenium robustum]|uniref:Chromosome partition protein Smc n=1 Tax=Ketogulonicigenium robustum TaxID=92947 RepID=A0A1W6NX67_9RHOB|nr:chromosome segregation protein SMC [Ketogulonicigenium robustum]ARO13789.1 SMC protein [Ketogulonicigenium robustum]